MSESHADEVHRLRNTMRDLVAFSTLPAVWAGRDADGVAGSFAEILLTTLSLDLVYLRFRHPASGGDIEVVRAKGLPVDAEQARKVAGTLVPWITRGTSEPPPSVVDPLGGAEVRVAAARFGYVGDEGVVVACCRRNDFPTEADRLLLGVGTNQTAVVLQRLGAERALSEERERLRTTLASIGDAVVATDAEGRVTFLNAAAESLTGWAQAEAAGLPLSDVFRIVNEHTRLAVENPALRALREGVVVGLANHTVLIARDGTERPIDDSAAPIRTAAGTGVGAVLVFRDVTERKLAEEAHLRLAAIVESSDDAIASKTLDGVIRSWNAGAERLFGYTAAEVIGQPITLIIPPERLDEERDILARLRRGERIDHFETVRVAKDGRRLDISLTVSPLRNAEGHVVGASKVARDVTELKRGRERLLAAVEAERRHLEEVFRLAPSFLAVLRGPEHVFERINDRYDELLGHRELVGRKVREAIPEVEGQGFFDLLDEVYRTGEPYVGSGVRVGLRRRPGGPLEERVLEFVYQPLRGEGGAVSGILAHGVDLTERVRAEEEVREADRRKDEFIALLAHELRNPLAPIRNGLQVIRLSPDRAARERSQAMMDRQLGHMVRMIDDLLDVSRIGRNKMELRKARVALADVVNSAVETSRPAIEEAGHDLSVTLPGRPVFLDADLTRLSQVFSNLLTNSAKYTERGGRIWLSAAPSEDGVVVTVRDTGIGIPAESLPTIFDMFSQVDRTFERSTGGLGIGLALVRGLVEMHGGRVTAASEGQGRGSTFTVTLPTLAPVPEGASAPQPEPTVPRQGRRILVVDDNRDGAESLSEMLLLFGHEVRTAHDGLEAIEAAGEFRPEVILMDVGMPKLNGLDATRRIREQSWGKGITIVALTGWGQENDRERSREAGCDGHLVKPVNLTDLEKLLTELRGLSAR